MTTNDTWLDTLLTVANVSLKVGLSLFFLAMTLVFVGALYYAIKDYE